MAYIDIDNVTERRGFHSIIESCVHVMGGHYSSCLNLETQSQTQLFTYSLQKGAYVKKDVKNKACNGKIRANDREVMYHYVNVRLESLFSIDRKKKHFSNTFTIRCSLTDEMFNITCGSLILYHNKSLFFKTCQLHLDIHLNQLCRVHVSFRYLDCFSCHVVVDNDIGGCCAVVIVF